LKQQWGKFSDDDFQQIEGNCEKLICHIQAQYAGKKVELL
jgi:uncharacterized protein YjbJ (UPF0337 family)